MHSHVQKEHQSQRADRPASDDNFSVISLTYGMKCGARRRRCSHRLLLVRAEPSVPASTDSGPGEELKVNLRNLILASLLVIVGMNLARQAAAQPSMSTAPSLAPGDLLEVHMFDFPDLGGSPLRVHIGADGSVHLPYAGTIQAAGRSPDQIQEDVVSALKTRGIVKDPNVTVEVVSAIGMVVQVMGEVRTPTAVPLLAPAPLTFVLGQAGGLTGIASHSLTILHRGDQPPTSVYYNPDKMTPEVLNTTIQPGDIINVSRSGVYFVVGEVARAGIFPIGGAISVGQASPQSGMGVVDNVTLLQALAQAGGITSIAARSKMMILRVIDGKREIIVVDEVKLYKGEVADPIIHPGDIIYIPSSYLRQQTNNLFATALSGLYAATQLKSLNP